MINLTIQSGNLKDIDLVRISDYSIISSIGNNQTASVPYDNYLLQFSANVSSITFPNLFSNLSNVYADGMTIALIFLIIILAILFVKRLGD